MAESKVIVFSYPELAEMLVKKQNIHEGHWGLFFKFGIQGANIPIGPTQDQILPSAVVPVLEVGIQQFDKANSLTVDAAKVNPKTSQAARSVKAAKPKKR